ncbi:MAG: nicotinate-nucleotide adenylyltransferase [Caulobacteraceae bacterium]|nr:nicotinate-nucleotide adenylyltransferase [Caulobacteraceae bacterium]
MWFPGPARRVPEAGRPSALRLGFDLAPGMRVGLYGGSFNPAHEGHAHVAETALARLGLDRVIWLVSPQNPLKRRLPADLEERMASVRKIARGPSMIVSDLETRIGSAYTVDVIRVLQARFPGVRFVWVMGADNLAGFHRWRGWTQIMRLVPVAVVARPGYVLAGGLSAAARRFSHARRPASQAGRLAGARPPAWVYLTAPLKFISSTALRRQARAGAAEKPS